jgi:hypothetical protein
MFAEKIKSAADAVRNNAGERVVPGFLRPLDTAKIARDLKIEAIAAERIAREP